MVQGGLKRSRERGKKLHLYTVLLKEGTQLPRGESGAVE